MTELWRDRLGGYEAMLAAGVDMVVGEANVRYLRSAHFDDVLEIETVVRRLGDTSLTTGLLVRRDGELLVEGELRHVFVDAEAMTKARIPDAFRQALAALGG
jgi:acyl-CoA thioester hydrolase